MGRETDSQREIKVKIQAIQRVKDGETVANTFQLERQIEKQGERE